jgi:hypothetical protein
MSVISSGETLITRSAWRPNGYSPPLSAIRGALRAQAPKAAGLETTHCGHSGRAANHPLPTLGTDIIPVIILADRFAPIPVVRVEIVDACKRTSCHPSSEWRG